MTFSFTTLYKSFRERFYRVRHLNEAVKTIETHTWSTLKVTSLYHFVFQNISLSSCDLLNYDVCSLMNILKN